MLDPFAIPRFVGMVLKFWVSRIGLKAVVGLLAAGTVLAVILNYTV